MQLDPAGGGGHRLPPVLLAPALHEGHPDGAHPGQGVHRLEALVDGLGQQGGELLVVEDLEVAARRDLADGGGVPAVLLVAVRRLHKDRGLGQALGEYLAAHVVQPDALADVLPGVLDHVVPVDVGKDAEAEALAAAGVGEPVHGDVVLAGVEVLPDPGVGLVVGDGAPVGRLAVHDGLHINVVGEAGGGRGEVGHGLAARRNVAVRVVGDVARVERHIEVIRGLLVGARGCEVGETSVEFVEAGGLGGEAGQAGGGRRLRHHDRR